MIQRSIKTNFGGAWVFPGGKLDEYDLKDDINNYCRGLTDEVASQLLGVKSGGLNYWIACIRECFENVACYSLIEVMVRSSGPQKVKKKKFSMNIEIN
jgi:hypothetical protein